MPKKVSKKVALFNKVYREFQTNLLVSLKKTNDTVYSVKRQDQIDLFESQIAQHMSLYQAQDDELFTKVSLLVRIFHGKPQLNPQNTAVAWTYIRLFHSIASGVEEPPVTTATDPGLLKAAGISSTQMTSLMAEIANSKNKGLKSLVDDLTTQFQGIDQKMDPQQLIAAVMNPNQPNAMGIDFKKIFESTAQKIKSGEIDVSSITSALAK